MSFRKTLKGGLCSLPFLFLLHIGMRFNLALHSPSLIYWGGDGPKKNVEHILIAGSSSRIFSHLLNS